MDDVELETNLAASVASGWRLSLPA